MKTKICFSLRAELCKHFGRNNVMLFGTAVYFSEARDNDYMVYFGNMSQQNIDNTMIALGLHCVLMKSTNFSGSPSTVEIYKGECKGVDVDVCAVRDSALWAAWTCGCTVDSDSTCKVVAKEVQARSYAYMAKREDSTPMEVIKAVSGLMVMSLIFVEDQTSYRMCVDMLVDVGNHRQDCFKFITAIQTNERFIRGLCAQIVKLEEDAVTAKLILEDCSEQLKQLKNQEKKWVIITENMKSEIVELKQAVLDATDANKKHAFALNTQAQKLIKLEELNNQLIIKASETTTNMSVTSKKIQKLQLMNESLQKKISGVLEDKAMEDESQKTNMKMVAAHKKTIEKLEVESRKTIGKLETEIKRMKSELMGCRGTIDTQKTIIRSQPSTGMLCAIKQMVSNEVNDCNEKAVEFMEDLHEISSNSAEKVFELPVHLNQYFRRAFICQSIYQSMSRTNSTNTFSYGFAFNKDRCEPQLQMVCTRKTETQLLVYLSNLENLVPGMFDSALNLKLWTILDITSKQFDEVYHITKPGEVLKHMRFTLMIIVQKMMNTEIETETIVNKVIGRKLSLF